MDPVRKISSITEFASDPMILANKLINVEKSKEGVFEVDIVNAYETEIKAFQSDPTSTNLKTNLATLEPSKAYVIEYKVDSSRGQNHYLVKAVIRNKKLFVATVQTKNEDFDQLSKEANTIINSIQLISTDESRQ